MIFLQRDSIANLIKLKMPQIDEHSNRIESSMIKNFAEEMRLEKEQKLKTSQEALFFTVVESSTPGIFSQDDSFLKDEKNKDKQILQQSLVIEGQIKNYLEKITIKPQETQKQKLNKMSERFNSIDEIQEKSMKLQK